MRAFLIWHDTCRLPDHSSDKIASKALEFLAPMFGPGLIVADCSTPALHGVIVEQPVFGCRLAFAEADEETDVQAIEYPLNARAVLSRSLQRVPESLLPALCRELERSPERVLSELAPPFSLLWFRKANHSTTLQVDGLGQAPLFEFENGRLWAVTNHLALLQILGVELQPLPAEWAAWSAVAGWFPMDLTGFRGVRRVAPGTRLRVDRDGIHRTVFDLPPNWLHPSPLSVEDRREAARQSLLDMLGEVLRFADDFDVGLSGGWDTRAVVSSLHALGANFRPRVKGPAHSPDVLRATELARLGGLDLIVTNHSEPASDSWQDSARSVALALRWQAGEMDIDKHKTLFACGRRFLQARINMMGQHGELVRGRFYDKLIREGRITVDIGDDDIEEATTREYLKRLPPFVRSDVAEQVREIIIASLRQAGRFGLHGLLLLDFHFLYEYTRRRNAGSLASQNNLVVAPFLNPEIIRCCFGSSPEEKAFLRFHRHIIEINAPGWIDVPFAQFTAPFEFEAQADLVDPVRAAEAFFIRTARDSRYYDAIAWWKSAGQPLLAEAIETDGFLSEVFDQVAMRRTPTAAPDDIVVMAALSKAAAAAVV